MLETQPAPDGGLSIGVTIRALRESRGLASDELGRLIGKSGSLVRLIELGKKRATLHVCVEIARVLNVPVARLVGDKLAAIIADGSAKPES